MVKDTSRIYSNDISDSIRTTINVSPSFEGRDNQHMPTGSVHYNIPPGFTSTISNVGVGLDQNNSLLHLLSYDVNREPEEVTSCKRKERDELQTATSMVTTVSSQKRRLLTIIEEALLLTSET